MLLNCTLKPKTGGFPIIKESLNPHPDKRKKTHQIDFECLKKLPDFQFLPGE